MTRRLRWGVFWGAFAALGCDGVLMGPGLDGGPGGSDADPARQRDIDFIDQGLDPVDQGLPDQDAPDQGLTDQGAPDQGLPDQGAPDQGVPLATITTTRTADRITVTSTLAPTWKLVIATAASASHARPGGGSAIALHIPASASDSLVDPSPSFCCSAKGLDNLEWRYVPSGTTQGVRSDMARNARIQRLDVLTNTSTRLELRIEGSWPGVSSFTREITVTPEGYATTMDLTYDGVTGNKSMWWLLSLFHSDAVDGEAVTIDDADTSWLPLRQSKEFARPIPSAIGFPYRVAFPLKGLSGQSIVLQVDRFADASSNSRYYELWPEERGYYFFFPRWVSTFKHTTYRFEWSWRFVPPP